MKGVCDMTYTDEEKMIIINRLNEGDSIKAICNEYGVSRSTLYRWTHDGEESTSARKMGKYIQPKIGTYYSVGWKS